MLRIASKPQNGLYEFPHWVTVSEYLALCCNGNSYACLTIIVVSCRVVNWHFCTQILKFWLVQRTWLFWKSNVMPFKNAQLVPKPTPTHNKLTPVTAQSRLKMHV